MTFEEYLERSANYVAAIHAAGNKAWWEKRTDDPVEQLELRRSLFNRGRKQSKSPSDAV